MEKLTSKGKHKVKVRNHPHTNSIKTSNYETKKESTKAENIGNGSEIKRPAT